MAAGFGVSLLAAAGGVLIQGHATPLCETTPEGCTAIPLFMKVSQLAGGQSAGGRLPAITALSLLWGGLVLTVILRGTRAPLLQLRPHTKAFVRLRHPQQLPPLASRRTPRAASNPIPPAPCRLSNACDCSCPSLPLTSSPSSWCQPPCTSSTHAHRCAIPPSRPRRSCATIRSVGITELPHRCSKPSTSAANFERFHLSLSGLPGPAAARWT